MHHDAAVSLVSWNTDPRLVETGHRPRVDWVAPAVSTILAAGAITNKQFRGTVFSDDAKQYADNIGLTSAVNGDAVSAQKGALHGKTYSPLTRVTRPEEVDGCNKVIADLLYGQICTTDNGWFVQTVVGVVGELHDNVASHAYACGFSAAQVYRTGRGQRLEFAIADCGRGMLANVKSVDSSVATHTQAIDWCLKRRNTTARRASDMAQRLPPDSNL